MAALAESDVISIVESAFDTHLEIRDHLRLERAGDERRHRRLLHGEGAHHAHARQAA